MKKYIAAAVALLLVLAGIYFASPFLAVRSLKQAALAADRDAIEAKVDFPAVRDGLKAQMSAAMTARMQSDPEMRGNPFASLGALMMPAIVDRMVEAFVTPDGIAALMRGRKPGEKGGANPDIDRNMEYVGLDRFRVRLHDNRKKEDGPAFLFERRGFASWKLVRVELPPQIVDEKPWR